jgi:RNA polymerase primary sigma factor
LIESETESFVDEDTPSADEIADSADRLLFEESAEREIHESEIRPDLVQKATERLAADAQRGEGTISREDVNRAYHRLSLTISECVEVELALSGRGVAIRDEEEEIARAGAGGAAPRYLSFDHERDLARKIQLANKLHAHQILDDGSFTERVLADAQQARALFITTNQRYVWKLVRAVRLPRHLTQEDLFQEGMLGLLRATDTYDPELGFRFKTYATWWIERYIQRAIDNDDREVRLPVHLMEKLRKIRRAQSKLLLVTGKQPDIRTVAEATGMDPERLGKLLWRVQATDVVEGDAEIDDGMAIFELVADEQTPAPIDVVAEHELAEQLRSTLVSLSPREERVLRLRFGIDLNQAETLQTIGDRFGVTRERIRQIEAKALMKLKHPSRSRKLRSFLE